MHDAPLFLSLQSQHLHIGITEVPSSQSPACRNGFIVEPHKLAHHNCIYNTVTVSGSAFLLEDTIRVLHFEGKYTSHVASRV